MPIRIVANGRDPELAEFGAALHVPNVDTARRGGVDRLTVGRNGYAEHLLVVLEHRSRDLPSGPLERAICLRRVAGVETGEREQSGELRFTPGEEDLRRIGSEALGARLSSLFLRCCLVVARILGGLIGQVSVIAGLPGALVGEGGVVLGFLCALRRERCVRSRLTGKDDGDAGQDRCERQRTREQQRPPA